MRRTHATVLFIAIAAFPSGEYSAAFAANMGWQQIFGTTTADVANGVAVDGAGNIYAAGRTNGSLGGPNEGFSDSFIRKYSPTGQHLWSRQLGSDRIDSGEGVAADASGNAYVTGRTTGSLSGPNLGGQDVFLIKYSPTGDPLWTRQFGTNQSQSSDGVAVDASGNVYVCGTTFGDLGGQINSGSADAFLVKYSSAGTYLWTRLMGTEKDDTGHAVAVDNMGSIYVAGMTMGDLTGTESLDEDILVAKFDEAGNRIWTGALGFSLEEREERGFGVAADQLGNVFLTGYTQVNVGSDYVFVAKFDAEDAGFDPKWVRLFGAGYLDLETSDVGYSVAADGAGGAYVTGRFGTITGPGTYFDDQFVSKFDASGTQLWLQRFGSPAGGNSYGVSSDGRGNVYLAGESQADAFVAKFSDVAGDHDGDSDVDGADFLAWQRQQGSNAPRFTGADGDGDGVIGAGDLVVWQAAFGLAPSTELALRTVPEPSGQALLVMALAYCSSVVARAGVSDIRAHSFRAFLHRLRIRGTHADA